MSLHLRGASKLEKSATGYPSNTQSPCRSKRELSCCPSTLEFCSGQSCFANRISRSTALVRGPWSWVQAEDLLASVKPSLLNLYTTHPPELALIVRGQRQPSCQRMRRIQRSLFPISSPFRIEFEADFLISFRHAFRQGNRGQKIGKFTQLLQCRTRRCCPNSVLPLDAAARHPTLVPYPGASSFLPSGSSS